MSESKFKVVIVGGSVSGLTLANMLERLGIDFVVLEAYHDIAPQVGASIGLHANGLRILDQIGCADALLSLLDKPIDNSFIRAPDGSVVAYNEDIMRPHTKRLGYRTIFIDRQMLLQILYKNLKSPQKVLTNKRITKIKNLDGYVEVATDSGESFRGDILIGADGIHSTIRREMWRVASQVSPDYFPHDEWSRVPADYKCIFGISKPNKKLSCPSVHYVMNNGYSYLILLGPEDRIYFFLFVKLARTLYGDQVPRYTKADETTLASEHASDPITPEITFGDIYEARTSSVLTSLYEHVFEKWHYKRVFTLGDSAHKVEPLTGQGGNGAIESAAVLVNHLYRSLKQHPNGLSDSDVHAVFQNAQSDRKERITWLKDEAHERQRGQALETTALAVMENVLPRMVSRQKVLQILSVPMLGARRIEVLPMPYRPHSIPFDDELHAAPLGRTPGRLVTGLATVAQGTLAWLSFKHLVSLQIPTTFGGAPLRRSYTGFQGVDGLLSVLVAVFGRAITGSDPAARTQWICFLPLLASCSTEWTIESYKVGANTSLISWPSLYSTAYQLLGIGRMTPFYNIASMISPLTHGSTITGSVPTEVADALLPSVAVGYAIPSILMMTPFKNTDLWQIFIAIWQPSPVVISVLVAAISKVLQKKTQASRKRMEEKTPKSRGNSLKRAYRVSFGVSALVHMSYMYRILKSPDMSIARVFFPSATSSAGKEIANFLKWDMALTAGSVLVQGLHRIFELRSIGYISTTEAAKAAACFCLGQVVVGPAAAQIGLGAWRERVATSFSK